MAEAREIIALLDAACGVGNTQGLPVFTGRERELIELGIRRALARGYRILAPGELDRPSLEAAAAKVDIRARMAGKVSNEATRALLEALPEAIRRLANPGSTQGGGG
jgi:hypothetical protein